MKRLIAAALAFASLSAFATGEHDGLYMCTYRKTTSLEQAYFSFHSRSDGTAGLVAAAPFEANFPFGDNISGYVIGTFNGNTLTGTSDSGTNRTIQIGPTFSFSGNVGVFPVTFNCFKIF